MSVDDRNDEGDDGERCNSGVYDQRPQQPPVYVITDVNEYTAAWWPRLIRVTRCNTWRTDD